MKICEYCKNEHTGEYTSGRFCSLKCSKGFSTKDKREEINKRISDKLKGKTKISLVKKICEYCENEFEVKRNRKNQKCCSRRCSTIKRFRGIKLDEPARRKISEGVKKSYIDGKKVYGGKTKWIDYNGIKVQGSYEYRSCFIFDRWKKEGKIKNWEYTNDRISYTFKGELSTYLIDFKIIRNDNSFYYIETKGYQTEKDLVKWNELRDQGFELVVWFESDIKKNEK